MGKRWDPDYVIAPGETLVEWLQETKLPETTQLRHLRITPSELVELKAGDMEITDELAARLESLTFISAKMWLALEHNYRAGLAAGKHRV